MEAKGIRDMSGLRMSLSSCKSLRTTEVSGDSLRNGLSLKSSWRSLGVAANRKVVTQERSKGVLGKHRPESYAQPDMRVLIPRVRKNTEKLHAGVGNVSSIASPPQSFIWSRRPEVNVWSQGLLHSQSTMKSFAPVLV